MCSHGCQWYSQGLVLSEEISMYSKIIFQSFHKGWHSPKIAMAFKFISDKQECYHILNADPALLIKLIFHLGINIFLDHSTKLLDSTNWPNNQESLFPSGAKKK